MPNGMPQGDGPAVDVEPCMVDAQLTGACHHLHGEGLVELHQVECRPWSVRPTPSARRVDSTGPMPMSSGERALTPVDTTLRQRFAGRVRGHGASLMTTTAAAAVVERDTRCRRSRSLGAEDRLQGGHCFKGHSRPRRVVPVHHAAVLAGVRGDVAGVEP